MHRRFSSLVLSKMKTFNCLNSFGCLFHLVQVFSSAIGQSKVHHTFPQPTVWKKKQPRLTNRCALEEEDVCIWRYLGAWRVEGGGSGGGRGREWRGRSVILNSPSSLAFALFFLGAFIYYWWKVFSEIFLSVFLNRSKHNRWSDVDENLRSPLFFSYCRFLCLLLPPIISCPICCVTDRIDKTTNYFLFVHRLSCPLVVFTLFTREREKELRFVLSTNIHSYVFVFLQAYV